jgi:TPP-dependent pyruvate/acetoin dehydrogenase alpha subunit
VLPGSEAVDPVARMRRHLEAYELVDPARDTRFAAEVEADVERALAEAMAAPKPAEATLFDDVYAQPPWSLIRQRDGR